MEWIEQVKAARSADLAEYFLRNGYECEINRSEMHIKDFGGLYINTDTGHWFCFAENKGGTNAVNCLTEILGMDFKTAVTELSGVNYSPTRDKHRTVEPTAKALQLPERAENMNRVFAYLCNERKLSRALVAQLAHEKLLYQDKNGNAVFVHKNERGEVVGAEIHGTNAERRFKGMAVGTANSVFSYRIGEPNKVYVFESAIDLLSFKQLADQQKIQNSLLVSMGGLKIDSIRNFIDSGIRVYSCVDNDEAGRAFEISNNLASCRKVLVENGVKDYNDVV